jgi:hypothetical protein
VLKALVGGERLGQLVEVAIFGEEFRHWWRGSRLMRRAGARRSFGSP